MSKGRKKKPLLQKQLEGTLRADRLPANMPDASAELMTPLSMLSEPMLGYFELLRGLIAEMGNDSATFAPALSLAAICMHEIAELTTQLELEGLNYETFSKEGTEMKRPHPAFTQRSDAMRRLATLLCEFGLTPSAIQKVGSLAKSRKEQSGFGEFIDG